MNLEVLFKESGIKLSLKSDDLTTNKVKYTTQEFGLMDQIICGVLPHACSIQPTKLVTLTPEVEQIIIDTMNSGEEFKDIASFCKACFRSRVKAVLAWNAQVPELVAAGQEAKVIEGFPFERDATSVQAFLVGALERCKVPKSDHAKIATRYGSKKKA